LIVGLISVSFAMRMIINVEYLEVITWWQCAKRSNLLNHSQRASDFCWAGGTSRHRSPCYKLFIAYFLLQVVQKIYLFLKMLTIHEHWLKKVI